MKRALVAFMVFVAVVSLGGTAGAAKEKWANDITEMTVVFDRHVQESGTTYCVYDVSVSLTHQGAVHVDAFASDGSPVAVAGANADYKGSGSEVFTTELWIRSGTTVTFGSALGVHRGPRNLVTLDTFTLPELTTCPA